MPRKKKVAEHELFNFDNYSDKETPKPTRKRKKTVKPTDPIIKPTIEQIDPIKDPIIIDPITPALETEPTVVVEEIQENIDENTTSITTPMSSRQRIKNYMKHRGY